jgi:hypothetical protein
MRILNWNLDHAGESKLPRQIARINEIAADIEVLTEPGRPDRFEVDSKVVVASKAERNTDESWVLIRGVRLEGIGANIPYERMATAARVQYEGHEVIVYASVLPWNAAASQAHDVFHLPEGLVPAAAIFGTLLTAQLLDIWVLREKYPEAELLWIGDFNTPVFEPFQRHNPAGSEMVKKALSNLGLRAYNGRLKHRNKNLYAIDLICGPTNIRGVHAGVDRSGEILELSDHPLYWVDVPNDFTGGT